jgi:hypothetical protein
MKILHKLSGPYSILIDGLLLISGLNLYCQAPGQVLDGPGVSILNIDAYRQRSCQDPCNNSRT